MTDADRPKLVVGVGASAGGLEAFKELLAELSSETGMAFLLVQHLDPSHDSMLRDLLAPLTEMAVHDANHGMTVEPNSVYVIKPDTSLAVRAGKIELSTPTLHRGVRLPVDHLFRSLAREYGARAVGIVLSGAGSDGAAGVRDIRTAGGLVLAQHPDSCRQPGMPQSAIKTGTVDVVLAIADVPAALQRFEALSSEATEEASINGTDEPKKRRATLSERDVDRLATLLDAQTGFHLQAYKRATIERRVLRRVALAGFESFEDYLAHLRVSLAEQQQLVRDLLITVTEFCRDRDAFRALREMVIDPLVADSTAGKTLRVWVPGCATGEEAYSIAMELLDAIQSHEKRLSIQIFATDVDQEALAFARAGVYPTSIAEQLSEQRLQTYFKHVDDQGYQVRQPLRDAVSFAPHDLTQDPPFSRMNLVSCRNVLIYLTPEAQQQVLELLHFALEPQGHLFLSTSESTGSHRDLFATLSKSHRIYRKIGASRHIRISRSRTRPVSEHGSQPKAAATSSESNAGQVAGDLGRRAVLQAIAPPTLVVAEDGSIVFSHGELGPYIRIPEGDNPRFELGAVLREGLAARVRSVLYKCRREKTAQFAWSSPEDGTPRVRIAARPAPLLGDAAVVLSFEQGDSREPAREPDDAPSVEHDAVVEQLEEELQATREDLRSTVEELESSNEELRSVNEESMSMNEELQSANEELEATTEELRSLNEELTTVNAQLREKVQQVERAHDDLSNFFGSTKVATMFLDENLCIKRFTPAAQELLEISEKDIGRYVADIARELLHDDLAEDARRVLDDLSTLAKDLFISGERWITRQVLPYRTESRRIEGVVVTFTDVTARRRANEALRRNARRLELAWEAAKGGVLEHSVPIDDTSYVSEEWAHVLGYRVAELPSPRLLLDWLAEQTHPDDRPQLQQTYASLLDGRADRYVLEQRIRHKSGHWIWVRKIGKVLERDGEGNPQQVLRMMIDITDLKEFEASLKESEQRFREMADGLPLMVWVHDENGAQQLVNHTFCTFFGVARAEMTGAHWRDFLHPEDAERYLGAFRSAIADKRPFHSEARVRHADGTWRWIESWGRPRLDPGGRFHGFVGTSLDITERRRIAEVLRESEERFRTLADNISQFAWMADSDGRPFWYNSRWYQYTGTNFEEMEATGSRAFHHPDHVERVFSNYQAQLEKGEPWEDTFPMRGADGKYRWFLARAVPIRDEEGQIVRWLGTSTNIGHLRDIEEKLRQADRQKDEFLAMLGHELRNPLAAIRTASELLRTSAEGHPELKKTQQVLERQTSHMAKLLDGLLDVSRIIRGKISLELEVLDIGSICAEIVDDAIASLGSRQLEIHADVPAKPLWVEADRVRLSQIIGNLLSNAVKYTPDGGTIHLSLTQESNLAVLLVRDTGVGIPEDLLPQVFDIFKQSPQSVDRSQGGLGLGLALVKTLAELHAGKVTVHSDGEGRGSEFRCELPVARVAKKHAPSTDSQVKAAQRVVLVEDNADAAEMLKMMLERSGHKVTVASTGRQGLEAMRNQKPDAVICDIGLPDGMTGLDVAREVRSDPAFASVRLVALSGYGLPEDKRKSVEAGFDAHLTKPVDIAGLKSVLSGAPAPGDAPTD